MRVQTDLIESAVTRFFSELPVGTHCAVAYSGGLDSSVLLHAFAATGQSFFVYHVNHQLSPNAQAWAQHISAQCVALSVPLTCLIVTTTPQPGESIEAWARGVRYGALIDALPVGSTLVTAHHESDQAETVLLQLMRGAGPKGLSSMASLQSLCTQKKIMLHRPFLQISKKAIEAYAKKYALTWIEDESNMHERFERNFIRHQALPLLQTRLPHVMETLARSAAHLQEQQALIDLCVNAWLPALQGTKPGTLSARELLTREPMVIKAVLRYWLASRGVRMPSQKRLESILKNVLSASSHAHPTVWVDDWVVTRHQDDLYVLSKQQWEPLTGYAWEWDPREPLCLPMGAGVLHEDGLRRVGVSVQPGETVRVCFRQGGEVIFVPGVGHQSLKKWFQTRDIPVWERDRTPLIYDGAETLRAILVECT